MATLKKLIECEISDFFAGFGHPGEPETPEEMQSQLLTRVMPLLAGIEQEPVYQACKEAGVWVDIEPDDVDSLKANGEQIRALYAAPQLPQPAVVDENGLLPCPFCGGKCDAKGWAGIAPGGGLAHGPECENCGSTADSLENWNRRAAMLQGAEPVSQPYTLPEGMVIVPVEPTREMRLQIHPIAEATCMECGRSVTADCEDNVLLSWADMIAAAPQQEAE
ncbi:hypothetical protein [Leclercia adecarboxylata]|uniref:hypothetical protein n=1 Tax=Leclercia adecarboxylata TaxID=83655 RepID=UPI0022E60A99|nr:hypothetical protein [Leclercia adecarboxylata]